jgi:hypothetical protein
MGLFKRKKEVKELNLSLPELPKFSVSEPELKLPKYEPVVRPFEKREESLAEIPMRPKLVKPSMPGYEEKIMPREEKPLFIKIDKYKEALNTIDRIKAKLNEADKILMDLTRINSEENREIQNWKSSIDSIRNKLLALDKELFEV